MMFSIKPFVPMIITGLIFYSCNLKKNDTTTLHSSNMGVLYKETQFYDSNGISTFRAPMKIWYKDSVAIEELVTVNSVTDTLKKTTVSFIPTGYKYIDLKNNCWYDYKTFNDTARIIKSGTLPNTIFPEGGWTFYVNHLTIKDEPQILTDTIIGSIKYMRIKFQALKKRPSNSYLIGYLRCDNKGKLFSFEKDFSSRFNCAMTRYYQFNESSSKPVASTEMEFLSDTLSEKELRIFAAWDKNRLNNPVH